MRTTTAILVLDDAEALILAGPIEAAGAGMLRAQPVLRAVTVEAQTAVHR